MLINKVYKFRIYPTQEQRILLTKTTGCNRFLTCGMILTKKQEKDWAIILALPNSLNKK
ncbi:helix-turn-helix domain-containing protein [Bacillus cereus]|uniref:helix-turn-helix domain-containing protein n=1 Tax=Bacillus cereus TaxID=1396 RepID=UPI001E2E02E3|nr:helix-turn-helix domain-containing protein [Bacillus cereus]